MPFSEQFYINTPIGIIPLPGLGCNGDSATGCTSDINPLRLRKVGCWNSWTSQHEGRNRASIILQPSPGICSLLPRSHVSCTLSQRSWSFAWTGSRMDAAGRRGVFLNLLLLLHNCSCSIQFFFAGTCWLIRLMFRGCIELVVFFRYPQAGRGYLRAPCSPAIHHSYWIIWQWRFIPLRVHYRSWQRNMISVNL